MDKKIYEECANWIAEQASDQLGGFIPAELLDLMFELEPKIRNNNNDQTMGHKAMSQFLYDGLINEGVPVEKTGLTKEILEELLHWEDECLSLSGHPREIHN
tara:strand:- start:1004 stop:1309 length:306 start_codon:yes stop_codon:yes gene_type:complete